MIMDDGFYDSPGLIIPLYPLPLHFLIVRQFSAPQIFRSYNWYYDFHFRFRFALFWI